MGRPTGPSRHRSGLEPVGPYSLDAHAPAGDHPTTAPRQDIPHHEATVAGEDQPGMVRGGSGDRPVGQGFIPADKVQPVTGCRRRQVNLKALGIEGAGGRATNDQRVGGVPSVAAGDRYGDRTRRLGG